MGVIVTRSFSIGIGRYRYSLQNVTPVTFFRYSNALLPISADFPTHFCRGYNDTFSLSLDTLLPGHRLIPSSRCYLINPLFKMLLALMSSWSICGSRRQRKLLLLVFKLGNILIAFYAGIYSRMEVMHRGNSRN